ncbi:MAG: hypothetical protein ACREOK_09230 [Gemmatimonadaceae bacterium]
MIHFHRFLIGTAILFCAAFSWWSFDASRASGAWVLKALAITFAIAVVALAYYLKNLQRFLHR